MLSIAFAFPTRPLTRFSAVCKTVEAHRAIVAAATMQPSVFSATRQLVRFVPRTTPVNANAAERFQTSAIHAELEKFATKLL